MENTPMNPNQNTAARPVMTATPVPLDLAALAAALNAPRGQGAIAAANIDGAGRIRLVSNRATRPVTGEAVEAGDDREEQEAPRDGVSLVKRRSWY